MLKKFLIGTFAAAVLLVGVTVSAYDFGTTTLKVGSTGEAVKAVQTLVGATADGSFGPMTKAKVKVWQAANGLTADGVFGAMSKAKANASSTVVTAGCPAGALFNSMTGASCATTTTLPAGCTAGALFSATTGAACTGTVVGGLTGGAGDIIVTPTSTDVESDVTEGTNNVKVVGFKVEADGSDVTLTNIKVTLSNISTANPTGSTRLERYMSDVSIYMGSTKVGSASVADFNKEGIVYTKNISLNGATIKDGVRPYFYVAVSAIPNIDTTDLSNEDWTVGASDIRFVDGSGAIMTNTQITYATNHTHPDFISLANSGDVKIVVSKGSNSPAAGNVEVSDTGSTSDVTMLEFKVKAQGTDITFDEMDFVLTGSINPNLIASDIYLKRGTETLGTMEAFTINATKTIPLDDDLTIPAGETYTFKVVAKINEIDVATFVQGVTFKIDFADFAGTHEDVQGDQVSTISGSALGETQTFYSKGVNASNFTSSYVTTTTDGVNSKQTYQVSFKLAAFGETYYIPKVVARNVTDALYLAAADAATAKDAGNGLGYRVETSAGVLTDATAVPATQSALTSNATTSGNYFEIPEGESRTFNATIEITDAGSTPGYYHLQLDQVLYDIDATEDGASIYTFAPAQNYETSDSKID